MHFSYPVVNHVPLGCLTTIDNECITFYITYIILLPSSTSDSKLFANFCMIYIYIYYCFLRSLRVVWYKYDNILAKMFVGSVLSPALTQSRDVYT